MQHRVSRPFITDVDAVYLAGEVWMLCEDFNNRVVPYGGNRARYKLSACGFDPHVVEEALGTDDYRRGVEGFIEAIAFGLIMNREVWVEVTFDSSEHHNVPFQVFPVNGVSRTTEGDVIQEIPNPAHISGQSRRGELDNERILLPTDRMVRATLPGAYPSEVLNRVITELAKHDDSEVLRWGFANVTGQGEVPRNFDFKEASRVKRLRLLQAALPIGWTAREILRPMDSRELSDYYYFLREMQFLHFIASMREQAEGALQDVLILAGERCGFTFTVTAQGIYTPDEVNSLIEQFRRGEIPFSTLSDIVRENAESDSLSRKRIVCRN